MDDFDYRSAKSILGSMRPLKAYILKAPREASLPIVSHAIHIVDEPTFNQTSQRKDDFDLHLVTDGSLTVQLDAETISLNEGDVFICAPGGTYSFKKVTGARFSCFHCHFKFSNWTVEAPAGSVHEWAGSLDSALCLPQIARLKSSLHEKFLKLIATQRQQRAGFVLSSSSQFLLILQDISEQVLGELFADRVDATMGQRHVSRTIDFIESHLGRNISLIDIAQHLGVNAAYLSRVFKSHTGRTVGQFIAEIKMNKAKERLLTGNLSIKQVAKSLGFSDALYFSRRFQRIAGVSPRAYSAKHDFDKTK